MNYKHRSNHHRKIITVRTTGDLTTNELAAMGILMRQKARKLNYKILFDYSLSKNYISITEAYYWFSDHYDPINKTLRYVTAAIVYNLEDEVFFDFLETTCTNAGINIKIFIEKKIALEWISKQDKTSNKAIN